MAANELEWHQTDDYAAWDAFVDASPQGTVFSKSDFLLSLQRPFHLYQVMVRDEVVAGIAAVEDASGRRLIEADHTPYQGILFARDDQALARTRVSDQFRISEFVIAALTRRYDAVAMALSWQVGDTRPFLWHNYHAPQLGQFSVQPRYTAVLDLDAIEADSYPGTTRACRQQELEKGAGYTVDAQADIEQFLVLHASTFSRQGIALAQPTIDLVRAITTRALERGYGRLCSCATPEGVAAMTLLLYDAKRAYYLFAASDTALYDSGAATRLMFENIFDAKQRGLSEFDFVGAHSPDGADFKLSFNAELKLYFDMRYTAPAAP